MTDILDTVPDADPDCTYVRVYRVHIGEWATIGYCFGVDVATGESTQFAADHRPARHIGEAVEAAQSEDELPICEVDSWQLL